MAIVNYERKNFPPLSFDILDISIYYYKKLAREIVIRINTPLNTVNKN